MIIHTTALCICKQQIDLQHVSSPEDVALVEIHQHHVTPHLSLVRTEHLLLLQVTVVLFEGLQTFGHVLIVDLVVEGVHVLLTKTLRTEDVEAHTLLQQGRALCATELLLSDLLQRNEKK